MADSTEQDFDLQDIPPELRTPEEQALLASRGASGQTFQSVSIRSAQGAWDDSALMTDSFDALLRTTFAADPADAADEPPAHALAKLMARVRADEAQPREGVSVASPVQDAAQKSAQTISQTASQTGKQLPVQATAQTSGQRTAQTSALAALSTQTARRPVAARSALSSGTRAQSGDRGVTGAAGPASRAAFLRRASLGGAVAALLALFMVLRPGGESDTSELEASVRTRGEVGQTGASVSVDLQAVLEHADGTVRPFPADAILRREEGLLFRFHVAPHAVGSRLLLLELGPSGQFQVLFQQGVTPVTPPAASSEEAQQTLEITDATGHALRYTPDGGAGDYHYFAMVVPVRTPTQPLDAGLLQALQSQLKASVAEEPAPGHVNVPGVPEPVFLDRLLVHFQPEVRP